MWIGNASNIAAPVAMSGDATMSNTGALTLASSGVTAGTYTQVTVDAKGRVTVGASPTTLAGYGITDAVKNAGGAPSVQEGLAASIPAAGTAGRVYLATDTKIIYRDNGATWDGMGAAGAVSSVSASSPLQSSGGATPSISFVNQNANLVLAGPTSGGAVAPTFRSLVAADIPTAAGDVSGAYSALSVDKIKGTVVSATAPTSNQVLQYNGSIWIPTTLTPTLPALADTKIWVGNGSSVAMPVSASGDVTLADTGAFTVTKLQGRAVASTAPTSNQVLTWNNTNTDWEPAAASGGTTISGGTTQVLPMFNAAGTNIINSSVTDNGATGVDFANSKITFGGNLWAHDTGGTTNAFVGITAGNTTLTGTSDTAVGQNALLALTTGSRNTAVGNSALTGVQYGVDNTAMGYKSLSKEQGDNSTAVGYQAIANSTLGYRNVSIGDSTLLMNTSGNDNVAVGQNALSGATNSDSNTAIGKGSLLGVVTGTKNTALGYGTGTNMTGSSGLNVVIGYNAGPTVNATYSNKLYIHNATSDTPLIGGDFSAGYVQINNQLEVPLTSTTPTPTAGYGRVYAKADGNLYYKNATTETQISGVAAGVTSIAATAPLNVSASTGAVTASLGLTSAHIYVGNGSNLAADVAMSGDASIPNTGAVKVLALQNIAVSATAPTPNQILQYNGSAWIPTTSTAQSSTLNDAKIWVGNSGNLAAPVSMSGDATLADTGALTLNTVPLSKGGTNVTSYATGSVPVSNGTSLTATICGLGQTLVSAGGTGFACGLQSASGSSLAAGDIWVGNASGIAVAAAPAGDVTMSNAGAFTVAKLQGRAVASTLPTSNQVLTWNSTNTDWEPTTSTGTTGSGTTNYVSKWTSASALGNSLIYDSGTAVGIGTAAPASRLHVPWLAGDAAATATFGSTNASNNQIAIVANTNSNWAIKATANDSGSYGAIYGVENNGGVGVQGDSFAGVGVYGGSSSGISGEFISDLASNSSPTLVVKQMGAGTADLVQIQNSAGTPMITFKSTGSVDVHGGDIVSDTVSNLAAVTNIIFSTGNVQTSANSTNNAAFKICGMKDGGSYSLVLTAQPVGSIPTFTAYSDAACSVAITNFDAGGVVLQTTSATTIITFIRAGSTVYAMLATGFTK